MAQFHKGQQQARRSVQSHQQRPLWFPGGWEAAGERSQLASRVAVPMRNLGEKWIPYRDSLFSGLWKGRERGREREKKEKGRKKGGRRERESRSYLFRREMERESVCTSLGGRGGLGRMHGFS